MKFIPAILLFTAAFIFVFYNRIIRENITAIFNNYIFAVNVMIKKSISSIKASAIIRLELAVFAVCVFMILLTGQIFLLAAAVPVMIIVPKLYVTSQRKKYISLYYASLPGFLESIIAGLKAGLSVIKTFQQIALRDKGPLGVEISMVLKKTELGSGFNSALLELKERIPIKENEIIVSAINTAQETGGNITEVLVSILETIRKRGELSREVKSLTSQGVLSGIIVGLLPLFMIAVICIMDPGFIAPLFNTTAGMLSLAAAAVMEITGGFFIAKIVDVK
jgi:tight adherence protein B